MYELSEDLAHFDVKALWRHYIIWESNLLIAWNLPKLFFAMFLQLHIFSSYQSNSTYWKKTCNGCNKYKITHTCFDILVARQIRSRCILPRNELMQSVVLYQNKCVVLYIYNIVEILIKLRFSEILW